MFGFDVIFTNLDIVSFIVAAGFTLYMLWEKNPFEKGTKDYESLRLCRTGLLLLVWGFGFGLIGAALALVAFILGVIGIVKGRTWYGVTLVVGSVIVPVVSMFSTLSRFIN